MAPKSIGRRATGADGLVMVPMVLDGPIGWVMVPNGLVMVPTV